MLDMSAMHGYVSKGSGLDWIDRLGALGENTVIEDGARIFHPENVFLGTDGFVGHNAIIDGYHKGSVKVGDGTWIGPFSFLHGAATLDIGKAVGIGPRVTILTSQHDLDRTEIPVLHAPLVFQPVRIADGVSIGAGAIILPGVSIGQGAVIGAGSVVLRDIPSLCVAMGNPARIARRR